jgi:uncharacterized protein (TIGR03067 family)
MHRYFALLLLTVVSPLGADPQKGSDAKGDLKAFQGVWLMTAVESNGQKSTPDDAKVIFKDNTYTLKVGTTLQEGTFKIDIDKNPKSMDWAVTSGPDKGLTYRGIYKFVDDELLVCFPKDTKADRPTEISGNAGNGQTLTVLKRKKD